MLDQESSRALSQAGTIAPTKHDAAVHISSQRAAKVWMAWRKKMITHCA